MLFGRSLIRQPEIEHSGEDSEMPRMSTAWRRSIVLLSILSVAALFGGCGSDDDGVVGPGGSELALFINELLANNSTGLADPDFGEKSDWIEIYNGEGEAVDMGGFGLTDDRSQPFKWVFPAGTMIPAGGFLIVWADDGDTTAIAHHANFKLSSGGEKAVLFDADGNVVDLVEFGAQVEDISYGRTADGGGQFGTFTVPTPGVTNGAAVTPAAIHINEFLADNENGIVDPDFGETGDWVELYNSGDLSANIGGWTMTDDLEDPGQWTFPPGTSIDGGGFLLVWADKNDTSAVAHHTNFKLSSGGESIGLFDGAGKVVDSLTYGEQQPDVSYGRIEDGESEFAGFGSPTPGESNENSTPDAPPVIHAVWISPAFPTAEDSVRITAIVTDDMSLGLVRLFHNIGGQTVVGMTETGADTFFVVLPPQPSETVVEYYMEATDEALQVTSAPSDAPASLFSYLVASAPPMVVINEFLASNDSTNIDPDFADYGDWLELYNAGASPVDLGGWYLTDDLADPTLWEIPSSTSLAVGAHLLIWADDGDTTGIALHTNFKLKSGGEEIGLFTAGQVPMDTLTYGVQATDVSYGRSTDGGSEWEFFDIPTPGESNE